MKFAVIALSMGCSALSCYWAVRPDSLQLDVARCLHLPAAQEEAPLAAAAPAPAPPAPICSIPKEQTLGLIADAAARHNVPAAFVQSIVAAESNFNSAALSAKGAVGLMQLMPETAQQFGADPSVPAQNIDAGTRYLKQLMGRYRGATKRVIAAYNAGPANVDRYHGIPPFKETRNYVARVLAFLKQFGGSRKHIGS
jgi:soluble lytic murein transglycosylase-like protein